MLTTRVLLPICPVLPPSAAAPRRHFRNTHPRINTAHSIHSLAPSNMNAMSTELPLVAVVTTAGCPYCRQAKEALTTAGIPYQEILIQDRLDVLNEIKNVTRQSTVPQVFINGQLVGGATEVTAGLADGSLEKLIAASTEPALPPAVQKAVSSLKHPTAPEDAETAAQRVETAKKEEAMEVLKAELQAAGFGSGGGASSSIFSSSQALLWLQNNKGMDVGAAVDVLKGLLAANKLTFASSSNNSMTVELKAENEMGLKWVSDCPLGSTLSAPLNVHYTWYGPPRSAVQISAHLRQMILNLYDTHLTRDGKKVNYKAMSKDPLFRKYVDATAELQTVSLSSLSREESMSFWINVYNALVVHATAMVGPAVGTFERLKWYDSVAYLISGSKFSLNDIEHGILRGNAPSPAALFSLLGFKKLAPKTFSKESDPRRKLSLTSVDPRIHFALNCGAASCPPIRVYSPERLEAGLEGAAAAFCGSEVRTDVENGVVRLSSIFKWYGGDFGSKGDLMHFLVGNVPEGAEREKLKKVVERSGGGENVKIEYLPYDWTVNAVE